MKNTKKIGILNVTPDSFSDGGIYATKESAIKRAQSMISDGTDYIDIGAESTRPNADYVDSNEEISRLDGVLQKVLEYTQNVSIDTRHYETAKFAINCGAKIINDVSGFRCNKTLELAAKHDVKCIFMHSVTVPANKLITLAEQGDCLIDYLINWALCKINEFEKFGIPKSGLVFDPGIGFGKTAEQSMYIIQSVCKFHKLNIPILIGHSRKSFLREHFRLSEPTTAELDFYTKKISDYLNGKVDFLRLHDVHL